VPGADVVIVGGGVIGWACARALVARGTRALVVDPGPLPGAATPASAGMLAAQSEAGHDGNDAVLALSVLARDTALATAQELQEHTGIDIGLTATGILHLAFDETEVRELRAMVARQRQLGLRADWLDADELREEWPGVALAVGAALAPEDAALDPRALVAALRVESERKGAVLAQERATGLEVRSARAVGVRTERGRHDADAIIIAAGAWSPTLSGLPQPLPVKPVRGQMLALPWPAPMSPAIVYGPGGYVLARGPDALVGSTMESVGFDTNTTPEAESALTRVARTVIPSLADLPVRRQWAGLRPLTPDGLPLVGRAAAPKNLFLATGHGRNGILLATLTGEIIADLVLAGRTSVDVSPFAPDRFIRRASSEHQPDG